MSKNKNVPDMYGKRFERHSYGKMISESELKCIAKDFGISDMIWDVEERPYFSFEDSIFYGIHVRGFTMDESSQCKYKGTFIGICEKLEYLKDLGVTSLILMPAYTFIERECKDICADTYPLKSEVINAQTNYLNYWGFKKGFYYAPKAEYAYGNDPCEEFRELVKCCHKKGLELLTQFYFTVDMDEVEVVKILKFWEKEYHVDGFQIVSEHPKFDWGEIVNSLKSAKLILHNGAEQKGNWALTLKEDKRIAFYDDRILQAYRKFIRGDEYTLEAVIDAFRKNDDRIAVLNRVADYDGFRLADLVSYDYKNNHENGEHNQDGSDYNFSWNCGVEGETENIDIIRLRKQQMRNFLCLLFLSQGAPYLFMGDEMAKTQKGNNNPYNQDNAISYLNWNDVVNNWDLLEFVKGLIAFRKKHKVLHQKSSLTGKDWNHFGMPDISFHGVEVYRPLDRPYRRELGIMLSGKYCLEQQEEDLYIACNMHNMPHSFRLPKIEIEKEWIKVLDTVDEKESVLFEDADKIEVSAHSIIVLITKTK